ncbi:MULTISPECIES: hypothetical protein [Myxococcus]|uniref:hypothetical protein n=1 Tax=Myxococcus TaxID=32 RepID=UPI001E3C44D6|nr:MULTISPECIES: hypothetical protein [Myxococcus]
MSGLERLLRVVRHRVLRLLEKRGALPAQGPEDALQAYQAHSLQQRLRRAEDGRIAYRMKRPLPDGTTHHLFTGLELLRRLASLVA